MKTRRRRGIYRPDKLVTQPDLILSHGVHCADLLPDPSSDKSHIVLQRVGHGGKWLSSLFGVANTIAAEADDITI
jgi:hypothetical protein